MGLLVPGLHRGQVSPNPPSDPAHTLLPITLRVRSRGLPQPQGRVWPAPRRSSSVPTRLPPPSLPRGTASRSPPQGLRAAVPSLRRLCLPPSVPIKCNVPRRALPKHPICRGVPCFTTSPSPPPPPLLRITFPFFFRSTYHHLGAFALMTLVFCAALRSACLGYHGLHRTWHTIDAQ